MLSANKAAALAELTSLSASLVNAAEAVNKVQSISESAETRGRRQDAAAAINDAATKIAKAIGDLVGDETDA